MLLALIPSLSKALGLGNINIQTQSEQPLRAYIELIAVNPNDLDQIEAKLADPKDFEWIGIERTSALEQLRFRPFVNASGIPAIAVTTADPLAQDSLNFLVEVRWPEGRLLREYTIKLETLVGDDVSPPLPTNPTVERVVATPRKPSPPSTTVAAPDPTVDDVNTTFSRQSESSAISPLTYPYTTVGGDTLYAIAKKYLPEGNVNATQMTLALFRANPEAFNNGDINNLKVNVSLRIPDLAEIEKLSRQPLQNEEKLATPEPEETQIQPAVRQRVDTDELTPESPPEAPATSGTGGDPPMLDAATNNVQLSAEQQGTEDAENTNPQTASAANPYLEIVTAETEPVEPKPGIVSTDDYIANLENTAALAHELAESRKQEINDLKSRLEELENMLLRQERLITLQTTQLTDIQKAALANSHQSTPIIWQWVLVALIGLTIMLMVLVLRLYRQD